MRENEPVARQEQLRIRDTKDILEALRSQDMRVRFSMLQAIVQHPEQAAAYGTKGGLDLIDELCRQAGALPDSPLRTLVLGALAGYRDPRILHLFVVVLHSSRSSETLTLAKRYLSDEAEEVVRPAIASLLFHHTSIGTALAAAGVMASFTNLNGREAIRIAVLGGSECNTPDLDRASESLWLAELGSPYAAGARRLLEEKGEAAFLHLKGAWERMSDDDRAWLIGWGGRRYPAYAVELILHGLESGTEPLLLAALEAISPPGVYGSIFAAHTGRHLKNTSPAVRLAAARGAAVGIDWEAALREEDDIPVRVAMVGRLADEKGEQAAPALVLLLKEEDHRLRAAAASALRRVAPAGAEQAKALMKHPTPAVRVAAAQVLLAAGEELWLEENVLR